jgi:hypothetical protein
MALAADPAASLTEPGNKKDNDTIRVLHEIVKTPWWRLRTNGVHQYEAQNGQAQRYHEQDIKPGQMIEDVTHCVFRLSVTNRQQTVCNSCRLSVNGRISST